MKTRADLLILSLLTPYLMACSGETSTTNNTDGAPGGDVVATDGHLDGRSHDGLPPPVDGAQADRGAATTCAVTPATFADSKTPALELHVMVGGNDSSATGTPGSPFGSVTAAVLDDRVGPGTAIRIHAGTYTNGASIDNLVGTAAAPIWIGGAPGEAPPIFDGQGLVISRVRYLIVHDLEVRNAPNSGINCDDGEDYANADATRHVIFRRLTIHDISGDGTQDCLRLSGVDDYFVLESEFSRCGSGVDQVGCHDGFVVGNRISEMTSNAVQAKGGSDNIEIRANWIENPGLRGVNMGGHSEIGDFRPPLATSGANSEASNIRVVSNVIKGGEAALAFVGCIACLAANNTILDPTRFPLRILQESVTGDGWTFAPCGEGRVINNIILYAVDGIDAYVNVGDDTAAGTFIFANNLWYGRDWPAFSEPQQLPVSESGGVYGEDPLFADESGDDYSIAGTGGAAFKGSSVAEAAADYQGLCYRTPPSIGAFEVP